MIWLVVAFVFALAVAAATVVSKGDPFQTAAKELGLKLSRSVPELTPRLDGMVHGLATKIDIVGGHQAAVRYRVFYPALGIALRLDRETTITRTLGQLGRGDQQIGDATFDAKFRVNTSRPDALKTMLTPELRRSLVELIDRYPGVVVADGETSLFNVNVEPPATELVTTTRDLVAVARLLVANRPAPATATDPPQTRPAAAAPRAPEAGRDETPGKTVNQARPAPAPVPVPPQLEESAPTTGSGLPQGFFEEAFGTNRLSFEDQGTFDNEIKGRIVTLSGVVRQANEAATDYDGSGQSKVVVTVARINSSLYGATDIDAVVYLNTRVDVERGANITFTGTADRIDAFMRSLYITDARLA